MYVEAEKAGLTSCSHVLARSDWLEAHKGDLHRQDEAHNVESAVSCKENPDEKSGNPNTLFHSCYASPCQLDFH